MGSRRSISIPARPLDAEEIQSGKELADYYGQGHPQRRSDCEAGPRPCPWVSCRYHLYLEVNEDTGRLHIRNPEVDVWDMGETCALDVAERGHHELEQIGDLLALTRERIRQVERDAMIKVGDEARKPPPRRPRLRRRPPRRG